MKIIKAGKVRLLVGLCLLAACSLGAQQTDNRFQNRRYNITQNEVSPDGKFISFKKSFDRSQDTLMLMRTDRAEHELFSTDGVLKSFFSLDNRLFIVKRKQIQILNPKNLELRFIDDVLQIEQMEKKIFVIVARNNNKILLVLDGEGNVEKEILNVDRVEYSENNEVFIIREGNGVQSLLVLNDLEPELLFEVPTRINSVSTADKDKIVWVSKTEYDNYYDLMCWDRKSRTMFRLSDLYGEKIFQLTSQNTVNVDEIYIRAFIKQDVPGQEKADIWYGDDPALQKKLLPSDERSVFLLWNLKANTVKVLGCDTLSEVVYIGDPRYYLAFNPYQIQDYTTHSIPLMLYRYDNPTNEVEEMGASGHRNYLNKAGNLLVSNVGDHWVLYDLHHLSKSTIELTGAENAYFSEDGKSIYFEQTGGVVQYYIASGKLKVMPTTADFYNSVLNASQKKLHLKYGFYKNLIDDRKILLELYRKRTGEKGYAELQNGQLKNILKPTGDRIFGFSYNISNQFFSYVKSNLDTPPTLFAGNRGISKLIYKSNKKDSEIFKIKNELFNYQSKEGEVLNSVLIYPLNYDPAKKYPMIVNIYEKQSHLRNVYLMDGYHGSTEGFNIRHFVENGYFVYLPDIGYGKQGAGLAALECVERSLDIISGNSSVDFNRLGLIGHSHGAYETNFIATHSKRFAAFVSGNGNSDLVSAYHSLSKTFTSPYFWQFENGQYRMPGSLADYRSLYNDNSPILFADQVSAPILLWAGKKDTNVNPNQTLEFYLALKRNKKNAVALFYENEGHTIFNEKSKNDLYSKISDWFDLYLKGIKSDWIGQMK